MSQAVKDNEQTGTLSWAKLWRWVLVLYIVAFFGYFVKASNQSPPVQFENIWQVVAIAFLPAIPFIIFAVPFFIWLAIRSFNIARCAGLAKFLAMIYIIWTFFQLISSRPL